MGLEKGILNISPKFLRKKLLSRNFKSCKKTHKDFKCCGFLRVRSYSVSMRT